VTILEIRHEQEEARFWVGRVTITGWAIEALAAASEYAAPYLARHVGGGWGEYGHCDEIQLTADEGRRRWAASADSGKVNRSNLLSRRDLVMSEYATSQGRLPWVITCLDRQGGTTVLLPEEY
jgi:hypothetical protein